MKAKTAFTAFSWVFLSLGLIGLMTSLSERELSSFPAIALLGFGLAGLGFRAYLDHGEAMTLKLLDKDSPAVESPLGAKDW